MFAKTILQRRILIPLVLLKTKVSCFADTRFHMWHHFSLLKKYNKKKKQGFYQSLYWVRATELGCFKIVNNSVTKEGIQSPHFTTPGPRYIMFKLSAFCMHVCACFTFDLAPNPHTHTDNARYASMQANTLHVSWRKRDLHHLPSTQQRHAKNGHPINLVKSLFFLQVLWVTETCVLV